MFLPASGETRNIRANGCKLKCSWGGTMSRSIQVKAVRCCLSLSTILFTNATLAQVASSTEGSSSSTIGVDEIIVTAQKRSESINKVPMSITALTADSLSDRGINRPEDLQKVVPGFTYTETASGTPVYTLRGIGFYDSSIAAAPAVSIYADQIPYTTSSMARLGTYDLVRVEVLKGPQGTLFGANSTGGAVNYIAAQPTSTLQAGGSIEYSRFATFRGAGYISGPLGQTLEGRLAFQITQGGDWQKSATRGDTLGQRDQFAGRLLLNWNPADGVAFKLNLNGWRDRSDTQQPQLLAITTSNPAACDPANPVVCVRPDVAASPDNPTNARTADWDPTYHYRRNDYFYLSAVSPALSDGWRRNPVPDRRHLSGRADRILFPGIAPRQFRRRQTALDLGRQL
jgi:outer membrane receptor protein involved in Fe transport